ncbi:hypothetical protein Dxin01_02775 [Deinococcus xinjiangensis]|uniref:Peptidoglycan binding domain-containing protein n=1 Tax=Deinococcus xinjiangensis TaxID=457454 RepID=A0ABP9VCQ8_9DEIO
MTSPTNIRRVVTADDVEIQTFNTLNEDLKAQKAKMLRATADLEEVKASVPAAAKSAADLATAQAKNTLDTASGNANSAAAAALASLATLPKFRSADQTNPPNPTQAELDANPNGIWGVKLNADGVAQQLKWQPHTLAGSWQSVGAPPASAQQVERARLLAVIASAFDSTNSANPRNPTAEEIAAFQSANGHTLIGGSRINAEGWRQPLIWQGGAWVVSQALPKLDTGLLADIAQTGQAVQQAAAETLLHAGVDERFISYDGTLPRRPTGDEWVADGQPDWYTGAALINGAWQKLRYHASVDGAGWEPVGGAVATQEAIINRGPVYIPDVVKGITDPQHRSFKINEALAAVKDRREIYLPAEYGVYEIAGEDPANGKAGLMVWPGQTIRGDGAATVLKNAVKNQQYGRMFGLPSVAGRHEHMQLLDFIVDHNCDKHIPGTVTVDISGTYSAHVRLLFRGIPLVAVFADSPEDAPTVGAILENIKGLSTWGTFLSFFGACEDFQLIGAHRYEQFRDDAIAFQESVRGYQRGHTGSGSLVFRDANKRQLVEGAGYSQPHALTLYGCVDMNLSGLTIDAQDVAAGAVGISGSQHNPAAQYRGGRRADNITLGPVFARRIGQSVAPVEGEGAWPRNAIRAENAGRVVVNGGTISESLNAGVNALDVLDMTLNNVVSTGNAGSGAEFDRSNATINGGDYSGSPAPFSGILATNGAIVQVNAIRAGSQQNALYAASGAKIIGYDVQAEGITGQVAVQDGGTVQVTGIRTAPGPLMSRGVVSGLDSGNPGSLPEHHLGQQPGMVRAMIRASTGGYAGQAYAKLAANPALIEVGVTPAPAAGQVVTVAWEAEV